MTTKPFKGVISHWYRDGAVVIGKCSYHPEMAEHLTAETMFNNSIVRGHEMHTSAVKKIEERGSFAICETKNSFYVLVEPKQ